MPVYILFCRQLVLHVTSYYRDAVALSLVNCFTSVFAGLVVFCVLGHMSFKTGLSIEKVATSGIFDSPRSVKGTNHLRNCFIMVLAQLIFTKSHFSKQSMLISGSPKNIFTFFIYYNRILENIIFNCNSFLMTYVGVKKVSNSTL